MAKRQVICKPHNTGRNYRSLSCFMSFQSFLSGHSQIPVSNRNFVASFRSGSENQSQKPPQNGNVCACACSRCSMTKSARFVPLVVCVFVCVSVCLSACLSTAMPLAPNSFFSLSPAVACARHDKMRESKRAVGFVEFREWISPGTARRRTATTTVRLVVDIIVSTNSLDRCIYSRYG